MSKRTEQDHTKAVLDFDRHARIGVAEAVFCESKTSAQIDVILDSFRERDTSCLLTRLDIAKVEALSQQHRERMDFDPVSRTAIMDGPLVLLPEEGAAPVAIISAGTSDAPVALEVARTLEFHGVPCKLYQDIGVAGLWRLSERIDAIREHPVVIAVAGMEGALFSVLGGLVGSVLIAVPTSVGYGVAEGGRLSLHSALGSCAPGVVTVNIDNGYGAACAAIRFLNFLNVTE